VKKSTALLCLLFFSLAATLSAAREVTLSTDTRSGIDIKTTYIHRSRASGPAGGFIPILIKINNRSDASHTWTLKSSSPWGRNSSTTIEYFTVGAGEEKAFRYNLPIDRSTSQDYMPRVTINGYGCAPNSYIGSHSYGNQTTSSLMTERVYKILKRSDSFNGSDSDLNIISPDLTPSDWRGLSGISSFFIDVRDWQELNDAQKEGVKEWLTAGGQLVINGTNRDYFQKTFNTQKDTVNFGFGSVSLSSESELIKKILKQSYYRGSLLDTLWHSQVQSVNKLVTPPEVNVWVVGFLMLVFVIVIGPVNLFVLARGIKRSRMLITTPIIALAASLIFALTIVISDGFGGEGHYSSDIWIEGDSHRAIVMQTQILKNGIMLNSSAKRPQNCAMANYRFAKRSHHYGHYGHEQRGSMQTASASQQAGVLGQGWFPSRSLRLHQMKNIQTTRAGLAFIPGDTPSCRSSFNMPLNKVMCIDKNGQAWYADKCGAGETVQLKKYSVAIYTKDKPLENFILSRQAAKRPSFFAEADNPGEFHLKTHEGITWTPQNIRFGGSLVEVAK